MTFWIIAAAGVLWIFLSATILVFVCVASSRYNQQKDVEQQALERNVYQEIPTRPVTSAPNR